jgi:methylthioribose-1-phosphate isomerase
MKRHIRFSESEPALLLLDQRLLPGQEKWFVCRRVKDVTEAIQRMVVRGAPAIGVTAAYGCCLAVNTVEESDPDWHSVLHEKLDRLTDARPTAVNLRWAVDMMRGAWLADPEIGTSDLYWMWLKQAKDIHAEDIAANKAMGRVGSELLPGEGTVMTHCNAGALATGGYGTALGVLRAAKSAGKTIQVVANETRPLLQGARLTAYELEHDNIPVRVACDNAAGLLMAKGMIDAVLVGADRIVSNGDTANKIGTYTLALLAQHHNVPFYVAAPSSTFDLQTASGEDIPIEERHSHEVTHIGGWCPVPDGVAAVNYAFDVTPNRLIHCFITEKGLIRPPFPENIPKALRGPSGPRR